MVRRILGGLQVGEAALVVLLLGVMVGAAVLLVRPALLEALLGLPPVAR